MTFQPDEGFSQVCPHLGLADDADSHATYSTEAHRCYNLANPTKIALPHQETYCLGANHVSCPVFLGQGIPAGRRAAPPPPAIQTDPFATRAGAAAAPIAAGAAMREGGPPRRRPPQTLGPRPRGGGISMPVATIGLFVLAVGVIALAFAVTQLAGGGDDDELTAAERFQTQQALNTETPAGNTPAGETPTEAVATTPAGAEDTATPENGETETPTEEPGGDVYVVESGDNCSTIAEGLGVDLQELLDANNMTTEDCTSLAVGDELIVP